MIIINSQKVLAKQIGFLTIPNLLHINSARPKRIYKMYNNFKNIILGFSNFIDKIILINNCDLTSFFDECEKSNVKINGTSVSETFISHFKKINGCEYGVNKHLMDLIHMHFKSTQIVGGTSTRVARYLDQAGIKNILHANSKDKALSDFFINNNVTLSQPKNLVERIHYIFEYNKGDKFKYGGNTHIAKNTDRIIFVEENEFPLEPIADDIFSHFDEGSSFLFICSMNTIKTDQQLEFLAKEYVEKIERAKGKNKELLVYFEDCGHHNLKFKIKVMKSLSSVVDIYSCNENEILELSEFFPKPPSLDDEIQYMIQALHNKFKFPTIIVHTKDYVLISGDRIKELFTPVKSGILASTHWYISGENPSLDDIKKVMSLPDRPKHFQTNKNNRIVSLPTKDTGSASGYTLGLGDCFVGALIVELVK